MKNKLELYENVHWFAVYDSNSEYLGRVRAQDSVHALRIGKVLYSTASTVVKV